MPSWSPGHLGGEDPLRPHLGRRPALDLPARRAGPGRAGLAQRQGRRPRRYRPGAAPALSRRGPDLLRRQGSARRSRSRTALRGHGPRARSGRGRAAAGASQARAGLRIRGEAKVPQGQGPRGARPAGRPPGVGTGQDGAARVDAQVGGGGGSRVWTVSGNGGPRVATAAVQARASGPVRRVRPGPIRSRVERRPSAAASQAWGRRPLRSSARASAPGASGPGSAERAARRAPTARHSGS